MSTNLRTRCAAGVLLAILWGGRSHAKQTAEEAKDLTPTARDLSDQGLRHYQHGEFDAAIESFMEAFALSNNAGLLFNVGQAFRLKGDCARAKDYYRRYLDAAPQTALKPSVERRLDEMESCLDANAAAANAPSAEPPVRDARVTALPTAALTIGLPPPSPPGPSQTRRALTWTLRGSAAALLASSAVFGALAWGARRDFDATSLQRSAWDASDRYRRDSTLAWSFAASGVACGVISYFVGRRP